VGKAHRGLTSFLDYRELRTSAAELLPYRYSQQRLVWNCWTGGLGKATWSDFF
jgi:hypothetical protein